MTNFAPLVVLDCDSTAITQEVIELLAEHTGTRAEVAAITEATMRGEYDFAESLQQRVATLKGAPESIFAEVAKQVTFSPGFHELIAAAHNSGGKICIVSGGFLEVLDLFLPATGVDRYHANRLTIVSQKLTGELQGEIVTATTKAQMLKKWAKEFSIPLAHTIAVGDGANDLEMMQVAGISVAFRAKPVVQAAADYQISNSLSEVIGLFAA